MSRRLLHELVPGLDGFVSPVDLVRRPTPVIEEAALAARWGQGELWVKRDDLTNPLYGGSKVRNLEFFLGRARMLGAEAVATMGPYGSHQVLATAVFGRQQGFLTRGLLTPQAAVREIDLNARLLPAFSMEVIRCPTFASVPWNMAKARLGRLGQSRPYWIPPGSNHPLGVMGVVEGALEVVEAVRNGTMPMPNDVVVPTGTCATTAGVYLAFAMAGLPVRVVAVRMVPMIVTGPRKMKRMAEQTLSLLRLHGFAGAVRWGDLLWVDSCAGPGYGLSNPLADRAECDVAEAGSFRTETTYTAKSLAFLSGGGLEQRRVLFWNTFSAVDPDRARVIAKDHLPNRTPQECLA